MKRYMSNLRDNSWTVLSMKKGNYNFPRILPIPRIPWNRPGPAFADHDRDPAVYQILLS